MPKRIVAQTVILQREGVAVTPAVGSTYDFTAEEIKTIERLNPEALEKVIAKDGAADASADSVTLTQAQLDQQVAAGVEKQRAQMEKDIRAQLEQEAKDKEAAAKPAKKSGGKDEEI